VYVLDKVKTIVCFEQAPKLVKEL